MGYWILRSQKGQCRGINTEGMIYNIDEQMWLATNLTTQHLRPWNYSTLTSCPYRLVAKSHGRRQPEVEVHGDGQRYTKPEVNCCSRKFVTTSCTFKYPIKDWRETKTKQAMYDTDRVIVSADFFFRSGCGGATMQQWVTRMGMDEVWMQCMYILWLWYGWGMAVVCMGYGCGVDEVCMRWYTSHQ